MEINRVLPFLKEGGRQIDGRVFFIEPPANIKPETISDEERIDPKKWTGWRMRNYEYLEHQLKNINENSLIADLGAGQISYKKLIERFPNYFGVDFYPYKNVSVVCDFTLELPIKDQSVDAIILSNVLEHVPTPELLLKECFRILKTGGAIVGTVPFIIKIHQEPHDFLRYTGFMLKKLFKETGFPQYELVPLGSTANLYRFSQKFFFGQLLSETHGAKKLFVQLARLLASLITIIFWPLYKQAGVSNKYPEGYGFTATKY